MFTVKYGDNKLTLNNFEQQVGKTMQQRGLEYYNSGTILDLGEDKGRWSAEVEGTDLYDVSLTIKNKDEITEHYCDCPYDGGICKHQVAVFYAVRDKIREQGSEKAKPKKKNLFVDLLDKISTAEFKEFMIAYAAKNKEFKPAFELYFADKDDRIDLGQMLGDQLLKAIKKAASRGYMDYRSTRSLAQEANHIIATGVELAAKHNFKDSYTIARIAVKEIMDVFTYADDSSGALQESFAEAADLLRSIASDESAPITVKEQVFNFLLRELGDKKYFEYGDFGDELFDIFTDLAQLLGKHQEYLDYLDTSTSKFNGKDDDYSRQFFIRQKIDFMKAIGRNEEAEAQEQQNMEIVEIRQAEVEKALEKADYPKAKKLINEGIEIANQKKHPGVVSNWEKQLLQIAILENDLPLTRKYLKQFAVEGRWFELNFYKKWKAAYPKDEWPAIIRVYVDKIERESTAYHQQNVLVPIYIEESYWDRLMAWAKKMDRLSWIIPYHEHLANRYPDELIKLYLPLLEEDASKTSTRDSYAALAEQMQMIMNTIPQSREQIIALAKKIASQTPRRPAMIEELKIITG